MEASDKQRRNTKQKALVLAVVKGRFDHPSAEDIYLSARGEDSHVSRATVYRNLKELSLSGQVNHIKVPGADRYDSRLDMHYHIICTMCSKVTDLPLEYSDDIDRAAGSVSDYIDIHHSTVFEGICPECRKLHLK